MVLLWTTPQNDLAHYTTTLYVQRSFQCWKASKDLIYFRRSAVCLRGPQIRVKMENNTWLLLTTIIWAAFLCRIFARAQYSHISNSGNYILSSLLREGDDKSLDLHTSRCRWTESIMPLERGVCLCAELQVFSCYRGWKEAYQATRTISTTSRREMS